jgi:antitoxin component YwqK of YwqJK toxin-antitoxin module
VSKKSVSLFKFLLLLSAIHVLIGCNGAKKETMISYWNNSDGSRTHVKSKCDYKDGQLHGYCFRYYDNGQLMSKTFYQEDRLLKIFCVFDSAGRKLDFGKLDENGTGYVITYEDYSGRRGYSGKYINGRREGWWKSYTSENYVSDSIFFKNSFPDFSPTLAIVMY